MLGVKIMFKLLTEEKSYLEILKEQAVRIPVRHPGFLEVPEGKSVEDLPMSHFQDLIKKHSWPAVSKALINLKVWNEKRNPKLSKWADDMQEKLAKWVESEREKKGDENLYEK